jgi:mono/diheme cytochrome c family protein
MLRKFRPDQLPILLTTGMAFLASACATSTLEQPSGERVFATHCASCHGTMGEGDGPVAPAISVAVPNLRALNQRYGGAFPADEVARYIDGRDLPDAHGERQMPVWGDVFEATENIVSGAEAPATRIAALLEHLRAIQYP